MTGSARTPPRVALVGEEEQAGVEAAEAVHAVGEAVAAAQQRAPRRCGRDGRAGRARRRDQGPPSVPVAAKSGSSCSSDAPERGAVALVAADDASCSESEVRSQVSMCHPDPAGRRGRSRRPSTRTRRRRAPRAGRRSAVSLLPSMLRVPSLKPMQVARRSAPVLVHDVFAEPELRPAHRVTTPTPIRASWRIACTATCGSLAQAWTHRSPSLRAGSRSSPGKCGRSARAAGRVRRRTVRAVRSEQRRAEPDRQGEPRRRQVQRLAGVVRRRLGASADRTGGTDRETGRHPPRGLGPQPHQRDQLGRVGGHDVERREVHAVLRRVAMPAWCGPSNATAAVTLLPAADLVAAQHRGGSQSRPPASAAPPAAMPSRRRRERWSAVMRPRWS